MQASASWSAGPAPTSTLDVATAAYVVFAAFADLVALCHNADSASVRKRLVDEPVGSLIGIAATLLADARRKAD